MRQNNNDTINLDVLNLTFDDIKNNPSVMSEIRTKWSNLGFLQNFEEGEKYDNLCIAYEQIDTCLSQDKYDLSLILNKLSFFYPYVKDEECENISDFFAVMIFPIIYKLYAALPLSDYDYLEIFHAVEKIDITEDEIDMLTKQECDIVAELSCLISQKINNLILKKYE